MDNLFIISFLALVVMNIILWIFVLLKSKSEEDIVGIIGEALKKGNCEAQYYRKIIYLPGYASKTDFIEKNSQIASWISALCDHLGVRIETQRAQPEKYVAVKKGRKT